ncbi:MAG: CPBP family intramembrane metalloprotease [Crocinitomicaceae bacterium]|nr:CPBP family intramembrane metalloprotease [Crocinitomicaceae bacterium]
MIDQHTTKTNNQLGSIVATISIVLLSYITIGQLPLLIAIKLNASKLDVFSAPSLQDYANVFGKNSLLLYLLIPFFVAFSALLVCIKLIHKKSILSYFTARTKFDVKRFFHAFFIWGSLLLLFILLTLSFKNQLSWHFKFESFIPLVIISLLLIPVQTSFEEFFFRGYLYKILKGSIKKNWLIVVFTGTIFGLMHGANPEVEVLGFGILIYYILTGVFLGLLRLMDDGLELSMGYHAINNLFAAVIVSNEWQAFQTDAMFIDHSKPTFGWDAILTICCIQPLLLIYFSKKYSWTNWKEKLSQ